MSNCDDDPLEEQDIENLEESQKDLEKDAACIEPIPQLPNFLTQVFYAIQQLKTTLRRGVTIAEISTFMKEHFNTSGDVWSRVETAVAKAHEDGFLMSAKSKYTLVAPLARVQNAKTVESRRSIAKELHKVFLYKSNLQKRNKSKSGKIKCRKCRRRKSRCSRRGQNSTTSRLTLSDKLSANNILAVLNHIEDVLMQLLKDKENAETQLDFAGDESRQSNLVVDYRQPGRSGGKEKPKAQSAPCSKSEKKAALKAKARTEKKGRKISLTKVSTKCGLKVGSKPKSKTKVGVKCAPKVQLSKDSSSARKRVRSENSESSLSKSQCTMSKRRKTSNSEDECSDGEDKESSKESKVCNKKRQNVKAEIKTNGKKKVLESCLASEKRKYVKGARKNDRKQPVRKCKFAINS